MAIFNSYVSLPEGAWRNSRKSATAVEEPRRACCAVPSGSSLLILGGVQNEVRGSGPGGRSAAIGRVFFRRGFRKTVAFNIEIYRKGDLEYPYLKNPPSQKKWTNHKRAWRIQMGIWYGMIDIAMI
jgi:hypothetical protein